MGYPGEPEEPGADKFYTGCWFLIFGLIFLILFFVCAITYGAALIVLVPIYILTFLLCSFAIPRTKSPTLRQVAMHYQFILVCYGGSTTLFFLGLYLHYLFTHQNP